MNQKQKNNIGRLIIVTIAMVYTCIYINVQQAKHQQNNFSIQETVETKIENLVETESITNNIQIEEEKKEYTTPYASDTVVQYDVRKAYVEPINMVISEEVHQAEENQESINKIIEEMKSNTSIYMDINVKCTLSKEQFVAILSDLKCDERGVLQRNAELIWELGEKYQINSIWVAAVIGEESGWGTSELAIEKNNIFSISTVEDGINMKGFSSEEECIQRFFELIHNSYLSEEGKWFMGTRIKDINFYYCPMHDDCCSCFDEKGNHTGNYCEFDYSWSKKVVGCMYTIYKSATEEE